MGIFGTDMKMKELIPILDAPNISEQKLWDEIDKYFHKADVGNILHVALVEVDVSISENIFDLLGRDAIYTSRFGPESIENKITLEYPVVNNGHGRAIVYPMEGHVFSDEEIEEITAIGIMTYQIMSRMRLKKCLEQSKYIDMLTGINNTPGITMQGKKLEALNELERYAVIFMNIKNMGFVNKVFGSQIGDYVITQYGKYLYGLSIRDQGFVSRLGGDNFLCIIKRSALLEFLDDIVSVDIPVETMDRKDIVSVKTHIGVYVCQVGDEFGRAMQNASTSAFFAKRIASKEPVFFNEKMNEQSMQMRKMLNDFPQAMLNGEFLVYYQPKVDVYTGKIRGAEALCRWNKKGHILTSEEFVPAIEHGGMMMDLDMFVLDKVCESYADWERRGISFDSVSINLSKNAIYDKNAVRRIREVIEKYQVPPQKITIEITEALETNEIAFILQFLEKVKLLGCKVSLDDFGTGHSSLEVLKKFDFDEIKLDCSYIENMEEYTQKERIVFDALIRLLKELKIPIVAECVENDEQLEYLKDIGSDILVQGNYFYRPLPKEEFEKLL